MTAATAEHRPDEPSYRGGCRLGMYVPLGERGCSASCGHRRMVEEYRLARHAQELRTEAAGAGQPGTSERRSFFRWGNAPQWSDSERSLTFKDWLKGLARRHDAERAACDESVVA